jgi:peptide-methionine (S)-S-oxide reductase
MKNYSLILTVNLLLALTACSQPAKEVHLQPMKGEEKMSNQIDTATFGAGCFWCVEAVYQQLEGVQKVISGFAGGKRENPTYEQVCSGATGHAEVCQIIYDPSKISFTELLEVFWTVHDPTTLNRQGADVGTQYRSVVFYHNEEQKKLAEHYKEELNKSGSFSSPVVTEIAPYTQFYSAEKYHQDYYNNNKNQPYCTMVIAPKVDKFKKVFKDKLKGH